MFLSHASEDKRVVRHLYKTLGANGFQPWMDEEDILPGQQWRDEIVKAVRMTDAILVCLSTRSITKDGYIREEIGLALDEANRRPKGTIFIVPALLEECALPESMREWHAVRLFERDGFKKLQKAMEKAKNDRDERHIQAAEARGHYFHDFPHRCWLCKAYLHSAVYTDCPEPKPTWVKKRQGLA